MEFNIFDFQHYNKRIKSNVEFKNSFSAWHISPFYTHWEHFIYTRSHQFIFILWFVMSHIYIHTPFSICFIWKTKQKIRQKRKRRKKKNLSQISTHNTNTHHNVHILYAMQCGIYFREIKFIYTHNSTLIYYT